MKAATGFALAALVLLTGAGAARANGAFPDEFSIHFPAGAPSRILMGANFGMLVSEDNGATWRYACEPWVVLGSSAALSDVPVNFYQVTADGKAFIASAIEITRSEDVACTWPVSGGAAIAGQIVIDIFASPADASLVFAIIAAGNNSTFVLVSHDGGKTFDATHVLDTVTNDLLSGIESARSAPAVVYATAVSNTGARLLRSDTSGAAGSWTSHDIPQAFTPAGTQARILAIDPANADIVYVRLLTGITDAIMVTVDGGQTFQTPFTVNGNFTSFVRATDGALYAGTAAGALYVRPPAATQFQTTPLPAPHLRCLGQRFGEPTRIYACGDMVLDGYSLFFTDDGGHTFTPVMKFTDLKGPLTCSPVQTNCAAHWERIQGVLGIGGVPDAGGGGGGGAGGGGGGGGGSTKGSCGSIGADPTALLLLLAFALRKNAKHREKFRWNIARR